MPEQKLPKREDEEIAKQSRQIPAPTNGAHAPERYPDERYGRSDDAPPMSDTSGPRASE